MPSPSISLVHYFRNKECDPYPDEDLCWCPVGYTSKLDISSHEVYIYAEKKKKA